MTRLSTDRVDFALDVDDAWIITDGDIVFTTGIDAYKQECLISLRMVKGEFALDPELGVPLFTDLLGQKFNLDRMRQVYREQLLAVPNTVSIERLAIDFDPQTRAATVDFATKTTFGDTLVTSVQL
jgi:hypothetical protein